MHPSQKGIWVRYARRGESIRLRIESPLFFFLEISMSNPQFVLAAEKTPEQIDVWKMETGGWSIQDHMTAAKATEGGSPISREPRSGSR